MTTQTVLIVDDYPDTADTCAALLKAGGYRAQTARSGLAALALSRAMRPDVVLLDIGLPDISGLEVCRLLRAREQNGLRIVTISGWTARSVRDAAVQAGADLHLLKPVDVETLWAAVEPDGRRRA